MKWIAATEYTEDCFNKWGYNPFHAILEKREIVKGCYWDFTILKHDNGSYIPAHGGCKMAPVNTLTAAKKVIREYIKTI